MLNYINQKVLEFENSKLTEELKDKIEALQKTEQIFQEQNEKHFREKFQQMEDNQNQMTEKNKIIDNLNEKIDKLQKIITTGNAEINNRSQINLKHQNAVQIGINKQQEFLKMQLSAEIRLFDNDKLLFENEKIQLQNERKKIEVDKQHIDQLFNQIQTDREQIENERSNLLTQRASMRSLKNDKCDSSQIYKQLDELQSLRQKCENQQKILEEYNQQQISKHDYKNKIDSDVFSIQLNSETTNTQDKFIFLEKQLKECQQKFEFQESKIKEIQSNTQSTKQKLEQSEDLIRDLNQQIDILQRQNQLEKQEKDQYKQQAEEVLHHKQQFIMLQDEQNLLKSKLNESQEIILMTQKELQNTKNSLLQLEEELKNAYENNNELKNKIQQLSQSSFEYQLRIEDLQIQISERDARNELNIDSEDFKRSQIVSNQQKLINKENKLNVEDQNKLNSDRCIIQCLQKKIKATEMNQILLQKQVNSIKLENQILQADLKQEQEISKQLNQEVRLLLISKEDLQNYCNSLEQHLSETQSEYERSIKYLSEQEEIKNYKMNEQELDYQNQNTPSIKTSISNIFSNYLSQKENISYTSINKKKQCQKFSSTNENQMCEEIIHINQKEINQCNKIQSSSAKQSKNYKNEKQQQIQNEVHQEPYKQNKMNNNQQYQNNIYNQQDNQDNLRLFVISPKTNSGPVRTSLNIRESSQNKQYERLNN